MTSVLLLSAGIVLMYPKLKIIFCMFGWHSWLTVKGAKRQCKHCGKRQSWIRVGKDGGWN